MADSIEEGLVFVEVLDEFLMAWRVGGGGGRSWRQQAGAVAVVVHAAR